MITLYDYILKVIEKATQEYDETIGKINDIHKQLGLPGVVSIKKRDEYIAERIAVKLREIRKDALTKYHKFVTNAITAQEKQTLLIHNLEHSIPLSLLLQVLDSLREDNNEILEQFNGEEEHDKD